MNRFHLDEDEDEHERQTELDHGLINAAKRNDVDEIRRLVNLGGDVNYNSGRALEEAVTGNHVEASRRRGF